MLTTSCQLSASAGPDLHSQAVQQQVAMVVKTIASHAVGESPHTVLQLDMPGAPIMPTISGWLLGYPVVYLVDAGNVDAAARLLSSIRLALHTVVASCAALKVLSRLSARWGLKPCFNYSACMRCAGSCCMRRRRRNRTAGGAGPAVQLHRSR